MAAPKPVLDITIFDSHNSKLLVIGDSSTYPSGFNIVNPTLAITIPGYPTRQIDFTERDINIYNSNSLGITCEVEFCALQELPDGIYTLKYAIAPALSYNVTKTFLRVDKLYAKFDEKFLNMEIFTCDRQLQRAQRAQVDEIEDYIQGAIAAANRCAPKLALELYHKANSLLNKLEVKCC